MAPKGWTTDAQATFLTSFLPLYDTYALRRQYQPFWDSINAKYLRKFPILPEGVALDTLSEEERQAYTEKLTKLYSRIKDWYRWRRNGRSRNTTHAVTSREMKDIYAPGTRTGKEYEVYVKMYPDAFQPVYDAECARLNACGRAKLSVWHKVAKEVWERSTEEEKAAVQAQLILDKEASTAEEEDPHTPDEYQKFWDKLPAVLTKTVSPPVRKAGVLAFVTVVGPVPNAGGQILATTLQFGDKPDTPLFSNTWQDHDRILVDQLANFAARYEFPPGVCAKRSHTQNVEEAGEGSGQDTAEEAAKNSGDGTLKEAAEGFGHGTPKEDAATGGDGSGSVSGQVTSPADVTLPSTIDLPRTEDIPVTSPAPIADGTASNSLDLSGCSGDWWQNTNWADPEVLETITRLNAPDVDATIPSSQLNDIPHLPDERSNNNNFAIPPFHAPVSEIVATESINLQQPVSHTTAATPFVPHEPNPSPTGSKVLAPQASAIPAHTSQPPAPNSSESLAMLAAPRAPVFDKPGPVPPAVYTPVFNASMTAPSHLPVPTSAMEPICNEPVAALTPPTLLGSGIIASATPAVPAQATSHATVPAKDASGNTPATGILATEHNSLMLAPGFDISTPLAFPLPWTSVNTKQSRNGKKQPPNNENAPLSCINSPSNGTPAGAPNGMMSTRTPLQGMDDSIRRSRRAPVPATRLEKQNEIGTNIVPPKPPMDAVSVIEEPFWFAPAYEYFKNIALGPMWTDLVEKWAEHERAKGWKSAKGLPAKGRPEEWQQWTSKARHGVRDYNRVPGVGDAADLGLAVTKWVSTFSSADFGRTGLHGMVALLTLMVWWGTAALTPSSWNTDSRPQWQALVRDLLDRFDLLLNASLVLKRSRDNDDSDEGHENKRLRMEPVGV